jgi:hypothetical protein
LFINKIIILHTMKNLALIFLTLLLGVAVSAQVTQSFRYQAVARDGAGNVLAGKDVSFRISFLLGSTSGSSVYIETHLRTTNAFGLVDLEIGLGTPVSGSFTGINWGADTYFVKVEMDPDGGTSYQWMGTSQLMSVPYALYAKDVQNNNDADADPANELQKISISGTVLTLDKSGGSVTLPSSGGGDNWGTQTVVTDATLGGNGTTSSPLKVADNSITSPKILDGTISSSDLAENSVTTPKITNLTVTTEKIVNTAVTSDKIASTAVTTEKLAEGSVTTEKINNGAITGTKIAQSGATSGQALKWNGTTWAPAEDETGSSNPTGPAGGDLTGSYPNPIIGDSKVTSVKILDATIATSDLANNSITTDKIGTGAVTGAKIAQAGATNGQALKWNGTTWAPAADATGGGTGGWTDDGTIIRLSTTTDTLQLGSVNRLGKFNVGGNIGLNATSSIYFGSDATRITGLTGGDLRLVAEDLSMLTTEDITFGHYGDETWIKFDNANKRVGIGTLTPADRLHVVLEEATTGLSAVKGIANPTTVTNYGIYGESKSASGYGVYGKSPKYGIYGTTTGNQGHGVVGEATNTASIGVQGIATNTSSTGVWGEGSNQGVYGFSSSSTGKGVYGKVTSPSGYSGYFEGGKFYVKGSAEVRDTLYADALKIANSPRVAYEKFSSSRTISTLNSWGPMDTITIVAPGPGFVMLNFSGTLFTNHTYLEGTWVGVGISTSPTSGVLAQVWWEFEHQLIGGFYQSPCAVNAVATISAAGTKKFYIVSYHWGTSAEEDVVHLNHGSFSALFIPSP